MVSQEDFSLIFMESDCFRNQHEDRRIILKWNVFRSHCNGSSKNPEAFFIFRSAMRRITSVQWSYTSLADPLQSGCGKRVNYLWRLKLESVGFLVHAQYKTARDFFRHSFDRVFRLKCIFHFFKENINELTSTEVTFASCNRDKLFRKCVMFYHGMLVR